MDKKVSFEGPPFHLKLAKWDQRMPPIYSRRVLCFSTPEDTIHSRERIEELLSATLQATVHELPFLAGSIIRPSAEAPWLYDIRPTGAARLISKEVSLDMQKLRETSFSPSFLDANDLCPYTKPVYNEDGPIDVCGIQANFIKGGLLLVVSIIHTVSDGHGISDILRVFANEFRAAQDGKLHSAPTPSTADHDLIYSFDRTLHLSGGSLTGDIENHSCWTTAPLRSYKGFDKKESTCANFLISAEALRDLKIAASPQSSAVDGISISTHDAIAAFIWRSIMLARQRAGVLPSTTVDFSTAIDCRTRLGLPEPWYGNAIYGIRTALELADLTGRPSNASTTGQSIPGLQLAASAIRTEINSSTGDKFRDLLAFVDRTNTLSLTRLAAMETLSKESILFVSYFWFGMHELDFGKMLKMEAFRIPRQGIIPGMPVVMPRLANGSCEVILNEEDGVMELIEHDDVFRRFAKRMA